MILGWEKTKELLAKYQIPMVESLVIESLGQGIAFAQKTGWPVVLKLVSNDVLHKIDKGLVKLNLQNEQQLDTAFRELRKEHPSSSEGEIIIQKQVGGIEIFIGMKRDKSFGPVVGFGLGGVFVEVLNDVVFGVCPLAENEALSMVKSIKGYKILQGYREQEKVDINKLADVLVAVSRLAIENGDIKEIDFNPVFANGDVVAVADAKMML